MRYKEALLDITLMYLLDSIFTNNKLRVVPQPASQSFEVHQPRLFSLASAFINHRVYTDFCI